MPVTCPIEQSSRVSHGYSGTRAIPTHLRTRRSARSGRRPSLLLVSRDLTKVLNDRYSGETQTLDYLDQLTSLANAN